MAQAAQPLKHYQSDSGELLLNVTAVISNLESLWKKSLVE